MMTFSTSEVAVCRSRRDRRARNSLSSRVFSMAMTAWAAKFVTSSICLSVNGRTSAVDGDGADQLVFLSIGTTEDVDRAHRQFGDRATGHSALSAAMSTI